MNDIKIGDAARFVQPVIEGEVTDIRYNKDANELECHLQYTDADGEVQNRWFLKSQLENTNA